MLSSASSSFGTGGGVTCVLAGASLSCGTGGGVTCALAGASLSFGKDGGVKIACVLGLSTGKRKGGYIFYGSRTLDARRVPSLNHTTTFTTPTTQRGEHSSSIFTRSTAGGVGGFNGWHKVLGLQILYSDLVLRISFCTF